MPDQLIRIAEEAAIASGKEIMRIFAAGEQGIFSKPDDSPVTRADRLSDIIIREQLAKTGLPILSEEEEDVPYAERKDWEMFWMVDPLDGTREFIKGLDEFTVNIALIHHRVPVAGVICIPGQELVYRGEPGTGVYRISQGRSIKIDPLPKPKQLSDLMKKPGAVIISSRSHQSADTRRFIEQFNHPVLKQAGSSLKFIQLIEGDADIYPRLEPTMEWDTAAAQAILKLTNRNIYHTDLNSVLLYNKADLTNPSFIAL